MFPVGLFINHIFSPHRRHSECVLKKQTKGAPGWLS